MNKRVLTGILAIILLFSGAIKARALSYHEGDAEEYIINQLGAANVPGMSVSIVTSQKEIYSAAFGNVEETSSNLKAGVLARTFTSLAVMQLVEDGAVKLEDSVLGYIDNTKAGLSSNITIKELLSYTDPVSQDVKLLNGLEAYDTSTNGGVLQINAKFNLLGEIIEKASGKSYANYIRENIISPLDMQSTYVIGEPGAVQGIIPGNRNYFGLPLKDSIPEDGECWLGIPSSGIVSNAKDLGKYMQMYLSAGGKTISYNTIESIMDKGEYAGKSIFGTDAYYSMGWISTEANGKKLYYCSGSIENYTSAMFIIPSLDVGVSMLFNSADVLTGQKFTDKIEAGVVSLVMGGTAESVSSNEYLMEHGIAGVICFLALVCGLLPLLMMEVWVRWTKERFSIIRLLLDIILHIILPTALIFLVSYYIGQWDIIIRAVPDLTYVAAGVIGLFYFGGVVKVISYFVITIHGNKEDNNAKENDLEENIEKDTGILQDDQNIGVNIPEYRARENEEDNNDKKEDTDKKLNTDKKGDKDKKDKWTEHIIKNIDSKIGKINNTSLEEDIQKTEDTVLQNIQDTNIEETIIEDKITGVTLEEPEEEQITKEEPEEQQEEQLAEEKSLTREENKESDIEKNKEKSKAGTINRDNKRPARENKENNNRPGTKNPVKPRPDQARKDSRPKRFVVVNDNAVSGKEKNHQENGTRNNKKGNSYKRQGINNKNTGNKNLNNKNAFNRGNMKNNFNKKH